MGIYSGLNDADLQAKITKFVTAQEELALGGGVVVIAGEGRRTEFVPSTASALDRILRELLAEAARRGLGSYTSPVGNIAVRIGK